MLVRRVKVRLIWDLETALADFLENETGQRDDDVQELQQALLGCDPRFVTGERDVGKNEQE